jgi:hypothetical protein
LKQAQQRLSRLVLNDGARSSLPQYRQINFSPSGFARDDRVEAPNEETLARVALAQAALGAYRSTETMRAFTEDEVAKIVAGLP